MKIAIINTHYYPNEFGGAERSIRFLAEAFAQAGHDVMVVVTGEQDSTEDIAGVRVVRLRTRNVAQGMHWAPSNVRKLAWHSLDTSNRRAAQAVAAVLAPFKPDVVHTNNLSGFSVAVWAEAKRLGAAVVHTLRDYYLLCPNTALFRNRRACAPERCTMCRLMSRSRIESTRLVDAVVGNSKFILDRHLREGAFAQACSTHIYNAYQPIKPGQVRHLPTNRPIVVGYIGRLAPTKGVELLLEQFARAHAMQPGRFFLRVAGDGDSTYGAALRERVHGLPVEFLGVVSPESFYESVDLVVVPSLWDEPLARVLFESFAHGVPVVASATGGSPELIDGEGKGWLFDPNDPSSLARLLLMVAESPAVYEQVSCTTLKESEHFTPKRVLREYERVYSTSHAGRADSC